VFKVIDLAPEGKPLASEDSTMVGPPEIGHLRWVELIETDQTALDLLRERFGFHPLALEDCATFEMRSKFDEYWDHLFIVLHTFTASPSDPTEIQIHEVHSFLSPHYLVTVHDNPLPAADTAWRKAAESREVLEFGTSWAFYRTVDYMIDATFPVIEQLVDRVEKIEDRVLTSGAPVDLGPLFSIRSTLVTMRRVMRPVRDVIAMVQRRTEPPFSERTSRYFRDVQDHVLRCLETMDEADGLISNTIQANETAQGNRTNAIMTKLTVFSAIFLPLGFVTGFWGQNFHDLPIASTGWFYVMLGVTVGLPVGLLTWFKSKGWL